MSKPTMLCRALGPAMVMSGLVGAPALANTNFQVNDANWSTDSNWNNGEPTASERAFVNNGGTARVTAGNSEVAGSGRIGDDTADTGGAGEGTLIVSGGSLTSGGNLSIGDDPGTTGTYEQTGGSVAVTGGGGDFEVGDGNATGAATGAFTMSGGTLETSGSAQADFEIAPGGNATAEVSGTAEIITEDSVTIGGGSGGNGTLTMSGGTINAGANLSDNGQNDFQVGDSGTSQGTFNFEGGVVNVGRYYQIGPGGEGEANHSGGDVNAANSSYIGGGSGAEGTYNLSGTAGLTVGNNLVLGNGGTGTMNQDGGTVGVTGAFGDEAAPNGDIILGNPADGDGSFNQSAGATSAQDLYIGNNGTGSYSISGGSLTLSGFMSVGGSINRDGDDVTGNSGSYTVSGADATIEVGDGFFADGEDATLAFNFGGSGVSLTDVLGGNEAIIQPATVDMGLLDSANAGQVGDTFALLSADGGIDGVPTLAAEDTDMWNISVVGANDGGETLQATLTAIPEPTSAALLGLGLGASGLRRRRCHA